MSSFRKNGFLTPTQSNCGVRRQLGFYAAKQRRGHDGRWGKMSMLVRAVRWCCWMVVGLVVLGMVGGCKQTADERLEPKDLTWAELRSVRGVAAIAAPDEQVRDAYPRERLVDGAGVELEAGELVWLRYDGGSTVLLRGPAKLTFRHDQLELQQGRLFAEAPTGISLRVKTAAGLLNLESVRASLEVDAKGALEAYVLRGELRLGDEHRVQAGERLTATAEAKPQIAPALAWHDWTGGLATTDRAPSPPPFGVGTIGARRPGATGGPRFPLAIQNMRVNVSIEKDFAHTVVTQQFFNPTSDTVEGIYQLRIPPGAQLVRFGVDRDGQVIWGRVKEKHAAAAQYQSNVYEGSQENPALLEWVGPGEYRARLYPIRPGMRRSIVVSYSHWLDRTGPDAARRLYVYPMAAQGADGVLPVIEEFRAEIDLSKAGATQVRSGFAGVKRGQSVVIRRHDFVPRSDLAIELFDNAGKTTAYRAQHVPDLQVLFPDQRDAAKESAKGEQDYVVVPLRAESLPPREGGLDLAIVVDNSAATTAADLAVARAAATALLSHLNADDRVALMLGSDSLVPAVGKLGFVSVVDEARQQLLAGLAKARPGGATDLGRILTEAARLLEPKRRGAVVYIGDGRPTVGELDRVKLLKQLQSLPRPTRLFTLGLGLNARMDLLSALARGGFSKRISDGYGAAEAALEVLTQADKPALLDVSVDFGGNVERLQPSGPLTLIEGQSTWVVGRVTKAMPSQLVLKTADSSQTVELDAHPLDDHGDSRQRWANGRLMDLLRAGEGRAVLVDLGSRYGILTPFTSFYVPTENELREERRQYEPEEEEEVELVTENADNKEGGTGTRAKGEEGSMGKETSRATNKRYAVKGPSDNPREQALREAAEFGMIGLLNSGASGEPPPEPMKDPAPRDEPEEAESDDAWAAGDAYGAGGLGLKAASKGGGGRGDGIGLGSLGTLGHGAGTGTGQGFGGGHGRLGGSHRTSAPRVRMGATTVTGKLPKEVIQRIVRQNYGRFRLCYEKGLGVNPNLEGRVSVRFKIAGDGSVGNVANGGSSLPDSGVVDCIVRAFYGLSFPKPEEGSVSVVYPIMFSPGGGASAPREPPKPVEESKPQGRVSVTVVVDNVQRVPSPCSPAAALPFSERLKLWRERLAGKSPLVSKDVYFATLHGCEAKSWQQRARLLSIMLDNLKTVEERVDLWQRMIGFQTERELLYRGILARVRTPQETRELHEALGLKTLSPSILADKLKAAKSLKERADMLRALAAQWPDDLALHLNWLGALEDAELYGQARDLCHDLRARADADAAVRTYVGELYLRLAERAKNAKEAEEDRAQAKRAFGEIVEFAPDDPGARRRLGDLLRAHGWYAEARRHYETLAELTPEDPTVQVLIATCAYGQGRIEEAMNWLDKARQSGDPDNPQGVASSALAVASTYLAWARQQARQDKEADVAKTLLTRARRLRSATKPGVANGLRVTLTWDHPDFHPTLWRSLGDSGTVATKMDPLLGIAELELPAAPEPIVEVRVDPAQLDAVARLGVQGRLTVAFDELGDKERIVSVPVRFLRDRLVPAEGRAKNPSDKDASLRFRIADGELKLLNGKEEVADG